MKIKFKRMTQYCSIQDRYSCAIIFALRQYRRSIIYRIFTSVSRTSLMKAGRFDAPIIVTKHYQRKKYGPSCLVLPIFTENPFNFSFLADYRTTSNLKEIIASITTVQDQCPTYSIFLTPLGSHTDLLYSVDFLYDSS